MLGESRAHQRVDVVDGDGSNVVQCERWGPLLLLLLLSLVPLPLLAVLFVVSAAVVTSRLSVAARSGMASVGLATVVSHRRGGRSARVVGIERILRIRRRRRCGGRRGAKAIAAEVKRASERRRGRSASAVAPSAAVATTSAARPVCVPPFSASVTTPADATHRSAAAERITGAKETAVANSTVGGRVAMMAAMVLLLCAS